MGAAAHWSRPVARRQRVPITAGRVAPRPAHPVPVSLTAVAALLSRSAVRRPLARITVGRLVAKLVRRVPASPMGAAALLSRPAVRRQRVPIIVVPPARRSARRVRVSPDVSPPVILFVSMTVELSFKDLVLDVTPPVSLIVSMTVGISYIAVSHVRTNEGNAKGNSIGFSSNPGIRGC